MNQTRDPEAPAPTRWQRLQSLYDEAMTLGTAQRPQFVVNSCLDDPVLRDQLMSLLIQPHADQATNDAISLAKQNSIALEPGYIIDRYRIVKHLGEGGMGVVYLAERADSEFQQQVALKLVSSNLISANVIARLRGERQILATLNHPNIARLIDGGATTDGRPYLVMEYVQGTRVDLYCSSHQLDIKSRLKLFQQVCAAVHAAHQQLIIHRDIKPSNILVSDAGIPKLLDFGIAKLIDADTRDNDTALTLFNERMLTPEYASPEQVRGEPLGTTSDMYSLGILLYELLTGLKPYRFKGNTLSQLEQLLQTQNPAKPSVAVIQARESTDMEIDAALPKILQGDLDTIVMKAMHRDIMRRYGSASALAEDIGNYLTNRPITARPDSISYITKKFYRRNRWTVSSLAAALIMVIGLIAFYTWRLTVERDVAQRERLTATRVSQFMTEVFRVANPNESRGNSVPVREVLDAAVARIDKDLGNEPRVQIELLQKMAQAYVGIGLWDSAESLLKRAVSRQRASFGEQNLELANALTQLAGIQHRQAQFGNEWTSLEQALAIRHALHTDQDRDSVLTMIAFAKNQAERGNLDAGEQTLHSAEDIVSNWRTTDNYISGKIYSGYGDILFNVSRYHEAENYYQKSLPLLHGALEQGADLYADTALALAGVFINENHLEQAKLQLIALLPELQRLYDANHPLIQSAWNELGIAYCESGEYQKCSAAFQHSVDIGKARSTIGSTSLAMQYGNLGSAYGDAGNMPAALNALQSALQMMIQERGDTDPNLMFLYYNQSIAFRQSGKLIEAEKAISTAELVAAHNSNQYNPSVHSVALERGRVLIAEKSYTAAVGKLKNALEKIPPEEQRLQASTHLALSQALLAMHQCDEAIKESKLAYEIRRTVMPKQNWFIYEAQSSLGNALSSCGHASEAEPMLIESVEQLRRLRDKDDYKLAEAERNLRTHQQRSAKIG